MLENINLTNAPEVDIEVVEGDKLSAQNATILITDAEGNNVNMTVYALVELNIYRDEDFKSKIYTFTTADSSLVLGDGFFTLVADPFTLNEKTYRYGLREMDSPLTLATGHFIVKRRY